MTKRNRKKVSEVAVETANEVTVVETANEITVVETVIEQQVDETITAHQIDESSLDCNIDEVDAYLAELPSVSARIRYLLSLGWSRKATAEKLGVIYQRVRNVEITPLKSEIKRMRQIEKELYNLKAAELITE